MGDEDDDEVFRSAVLPRAVDVLGVRTETDGLGLDGVLLAMLSVSGVGLAPETELVVNMLDSSDGVDEFSLRFSRLMPSTADATSKTLPAGLGVASPSEEEEGAGSAVAEADLIENVVMVDVM